MKIYFSVILAMLYAGFCRSQNSSDVARIDNPVNGPVTQYKVYGNDTVYTYVDEQPVFPGGDAGLIKFLVKNIQYPALERSTDVQGNVVVHFVISEKGKIEDVSILRGVSQGLDSEAIRVVKLLPKFKPGKQNGRAVKVFYNLPIIFKLQ